MARSLNTIRVTAELSANLLNEITGLTTGNPRTEVRGTAAPSATLASGTSALQADRIVQFTDKAVAVGTPWDLDLYDLGTDDAGGGAGRDRLGQLWVAVELVAILVTVKSTSAGSIILGNVGSGAAFNSLFNGSDTAELGPIPPGGFVMLANFANPAFAITDATNHLLRFAASGGTATITVTLLARSA